MGRYNDLDLSRWRDYNDIETDSLWIIDKRDKSGNHKGDYHGNFIPQIPNQLITLIKMANRQVMMLRS